MPTSIEWTDEVWNPTLGCSRISPGCDNCYAIAVAHRGLTPAHRGLTIRRPGEQPDWTGELRLLPDRLNLPSTWTTPRRVFVDSMSDLFHKAVPEQHIADVFDAMACHGPTALHTFQILTKRPHRMAQILNRWHHDFGYIGAPNVWLGTSIETDRYTYRADHIRQTPAAVRFLSLEPLLGPLPSLDLAGIDWVIVGGESGPGARPMHPDWVRDIRDACTDAAIPFLFKQWGTWLPYENDPQPPFLIGQDGELIDGHHLPAELTETCRPVRRDGITWWWPGGLEDCVYRRGPKDRRLLDGRTWDELPEARR